MLLKIYRLAAAVLLPLFFWFFHRGVLGAHFGPDEPMNLYTYWAPPVWKTMLANVTFWSHFTRPMAVVYYLPLYRTFGLNATPYNLVRNAILLVNVTLFYQLAFCVSRSRWVALLAAFPIAYHAALGYLAWGGAYIYDALCGGFYFAALLYYIRARKGGRRLGFGQACLFLLLYILALDSKEMAVTLPVLVLAYELLFQKLARDLRGLSAQFLPTLISGAVTLVFILGKTGHGSLTDLEAYRPVFTWARFSESNIHFLNELFYTNTFTMRSVVALWVLLFAAGLLRFRDPRWMFLWVWVMVTPLPIAFLPGRGGPQQYIVVAGWSIAVALACRALAQRLAWAWKAVRLPRRDLMAGSLLLCAGVYAQETRTVDQSQISGFRKNGEGTLAIIEQLKALQLRPKPGSSIVFLTDPFPGVYDMQFIANLVWNDHSLHIELQEHVHYSKEDLDRMDYLLDYAEGRLRVLRTPR
jgi:hypothetical protein